MTNIEPATVAILAARLAAFNVTTPYHAARAATVLMKLARRAANVAIRRCDGTLRYDAKLGRAVATWTEDDEAAADRACFRIRSAIIAELAPWTPHGARVLAVAGDPRGAVVKIELAGQEIGL